MQPVWQRFDSPPTQPLPGYEWLLLRAFNSPYRDTFLRLISSLEMKAALESLSTAPLKEGVDREEAIYQMLYTASIPEQMFLGSKPKHWPSIQTTHRKVAKVAQKLRELLAELDHFDVTCKAEDERNRARAPHQPYRSFHADKLFSYLDAHLELLAWACALPPPPPGDLEPRKRADPLDAALTLKRRLLKREVRNYYARPQWETLAVMVDVSLGISSDTTNDDSVRKS